MLYTYYNTHHIGVTTSWVSFRCRACAAETTRLAVLETPSASLASVFLTPWRRSSDIPVNRDDL